MGSAKDLIAAGLTSAATVMANGAVGVSRCCVVYHLDPVQALCLPGVADVLGTSGDAEVERRRWTMSESARHGR